MFRVLVVNRQGQVTRTHNHTDTGNFLPIAASLLLTSDVTPTYIAGTELIGSLGELSQLMGETPGWLMRATTRKRQSYNTAQQRKRKVSGRTFVEYFSMDLRAANGGPRQKRKRIDIINLDLLSEKPPTDPDQQLEMAVAIIEMCKHRGIKFRATRGGMGTAMLKASPLWTPNRRAAPRFINDTARESLRGNYYGVSSKVQRVTSIPHCYYIDQTSSHHSIVKQIKLPHPQGVHARGNYKTGKRWCDYESPLGATLRNTHVGLFYAKVNIGTIPISLQHLYPKWAHKSGTRFMWLWSPELRLFHNDHRLQVEYFVSSLTGTKNDDALTEYATWSLNEIALDVKKGKWKKGTLLSAYGMLAFQSKGTHTYRYWGGENSRTKVDIPFLGSMAESRLPLPTVQLPMVNVTARGVIEAETMVRSLEYARELHSQGFHIPQIYADGILVETDQLPFIPDGWRVSHELTNVFIPRSNAIISDEMVKLPGVLGSELDREWEERREKARVIIPNSGGRELASVV